MRAMHREVREEHTSGPDLRDNILRKFPVAHVWDDHDYGANNGNKTFPAKAGAIKAFDEYWPTYGRRLAGKKNGLWHKFMYGSLADIYMLDLRSQRDVNTDPDDANKSMLDGDMIPNSQKTWLKDNLRASTATWKFIASTVPWNPTVGGTAGKKDAWSGFQTEQQELVDFIRDEGITGVIFFSGDIHTGGAIDDGTNAYFPEMNVPYTNNSSDHTTCGINGLCGDWSEGWKPDGAGYGLVTVSPSAVLLQAKDEAGTVQYALTVPLAGPVSVTIDIAPGNDDNPINPYSNNYTVVAILSTNTAAGEPLDFDALQVAPASVRFGPGKAVAFTSQSRDEDRDGDTDLVLYIRIPDMGIACGDTETSLSGETYAGQRITGTDNIQTVGCGSE
jgi:alkaline phosphatase D